MEVLTEIFIICRCIREKVERSEIPTEVSGEKGERKKEKGERRKEKVGLKIACRKEFFDLQLKELICFGILRKDQKY